MGDKPAPKEDVARALLLRGSLFVHLDPREDGVVLPESLEREPQVMLQIGLDLAVPIPDLRVDADGISGTLSFARSPFRCEIPWSAVYAICAEDGRGMVWPESMPIEVEDEVLRELGRKPPQGLRLLAGGAQDESDDEDDEYEWHEEKAAADAPTPPRSHLRLVK